MGVARALEPYKTNATATRRDRRVMTELLASGRETAAFAKRTHWSLALVVDDAVIARWKETPPLILIANGARWTGGINGT